MRISPAFPLIALLALPAFAEVGFNRDIRPIMSDTCFRCHGPDKGSRMANLRLDLREEALKPNKRGETPIVPGKPDESLIIKRIFDTGAKVMPPAFAHKELTAAQKQTIRQWVAEGARYEGHWAYEPIRRPAAPASIDTFIRARLTKEGLTPNPAADKRTLLRRVSLDLTGLPPSIDELNAFLADNTPTAYQTVVDRLLASPRYAEKQALHWLDAVRYADTVGFHGDNPFPAWPYRDYVLRAFRDNMPFDQFTREQLAGDLLPNATRDQKTASAYNRMNRTSAEGGLQPKEYLAKYGADRVRTLSSVWLGATMGCSECHDHKFDPIKSRDFYSMKAFFADIKETGLVPDRGDEAFGTQITLPTDQQATALVDLKSKLTDATEALVKASAAISGEISAWEKDFLNRYEAGELNWRFQRPLTARSSGGAKLAIFNDEPVEAQVDSAGSIVTTKEPGNGLIIAGGPTPDNDTYTVTFRPGPGKWTALGVEIISDESLPGVRVARGADRLVVSEVEASILGRKLPFKLATSNVTFPALDLPEQAVIDGDRKTGWGITIYGNSNILFLALRFTEPVATTAQSVLTVRLRHDSEYRRATIGRFRLALSSAQHSWPVSNPRAGKAEERNALPDGVLKALKTPEADRTEKQREAIRKHFEWSNQSLEPLYIAKAQLEKQVSLLEASIPRVVVSEAVAEPEPTRILGRGNFMDESGDIVTPAIPGFLGTLNTNARATRLDLANWIVSRDNPLTARVFANRMWRQFFGNGLSKVLDDLGSQGEAPTHPELLDYLASEFMDGKDHPWDVRHLIRTIVLSDTYKQSSTPTPQQEEKDPGNRLYARQSRYRVEAEVVRDIALSASGLLANKFGGPSVRPYQPDGYLQALNFPKRDYSASRGDDLYRRGLYTVWQRTFLHPSLATFDAPSREECTVNRSGSNTPLQSLVLLNDPIYVEIARAFAQTALKNGGATFSTRLNYAFLRAMSRPPTKDESQILSGLYQKNLARYTAAPKEALAIVKAGEAPPLPTANTAELAAMTTVTRAILNLHETITRN